MRTRSSSDGRLGVLDAVAVAGLAMTLFVFSYLQSKHKMFWGDEIMGDYVLRAGSWHRFLYLWHTGIDSSGIWFYVLAKPWIGTFGSSELSLRMYSTAGISVAAVLLWVVARRFYSVAVTAISVSAVFLDVYIMRWQLANARSYGLFLAASALVLFLIVKGEAVSGERPRSWFLLFTFCAYGLLTGTHILGCLFAGTFVVAQVATDAWQRRKLRVSLYAAALLGIVVVAVFSLPNIRSTLEVGKPAFWTVRPLLRTAYFGGDTLDSPVRVIVVLLLAANVLRWRREPARDVIYVLLAISFALYELFVILSRVGTSIYVDRYLLPLALPLALLMAELLTQACGFTKPVLCRLFLGGVGVAVLVNVLNPRKMAMPQSDYVAPILAQVPPGLPIVDTDAGSFVEIEYYYHGRLNRPLLFPDDPEIAVDLRNPGGVSGFNEMHNFHRVGLDAPDIQSTEAVLASSSPFLVITATPPTTWLARRVRSNPGFHVEDLGVRTHGITQLHFWEVTRVK